MPCGDRAEGAGGCWSAGREAPEKTGQTLFCPAGFCAMGDLVSVCSLAFLDGPTVLHLKFTVALHLMEAEREKSKREVRPSSQTSPCRRWQERRAQFRSSSEDSMCSLIQGY